MMTWDDDALEYGYVATRPPDGGWWHLHFGRSPVEYHCELLGRRSNVFACVQHFGTGCTRRSPQFILTLDGEGVDCSATDLRLHCSWGRDANDGDLIAEATHFQQEVMPLLYDSEDFQRAVAELIRNQQHLRLVDAGKLQVVPA